ncbi:hypothetical protein GCM10008094_02100 [Aidingimonas halophila]|nr:hypothetical protein GCM10008094_02100 [Aidingimonas halophila]
MTSPWGLRRQTADSKASRARSVVIRGFIDQPTTDLPREQVDNHRQVEPAFVGVDVGDVAVSDHSGNGLKTALVL